MHIATKRHLPRRAFLRGSGAFLALPWLDAMLPAFATRAQAAEATVAPQRFVAVNYGLGFYSGDFFPKEPGAGYNAPSYLKIIERHREDFTVISGLSHVEQNGNNGHASGLTWLTAAKHPGLPGFRNSVSFDQLLLARMRPDTRFPCLVIGNSLSWTENGVELPAERSAAELFARMFIAGTPEEMKRQMSDLKKGRSVLDTVSTMSRRFQSGLGLRDREKMDQYLTSVRELESRIQQSEKWSQLPKPKVDVKPPQEIQDPNDIVAHQRQVFDIITLALQTDSTRIVTCGMGGSSKVPSIEGVTEAHHPLSHHGQDPDKVAQLRLVEKAEFREIDRFLTGLKTASDGHGSVLASTSVLVGSNLGNASGHSWRDLPLLLAGGRFKHGSHVVAGGEGLQNERLSNLFVQIARNMGVEIESFGSSDGTGVKGLDSVA